MTISDPKVPNCLWAQNHTHVYVTIQLADTTQTTLTLDQKSFKLTTTSNNQLYSVDLELFAPLVGSKQINSRNLVFQLEKGTDASWWPRLTLSKDKMWFVKTDFSRWRDEEDDEVTEDANLNPMSQMPGGMGGMGGMDFSQFGEGGMNFGGEGEDEHDDSDDEDVPATEEINSIPPQ